MSRTLRNGLFSAMTVTAMGFGVSQAFAAPSAPTGRLACEPWDEPRCISYCQEQMGADTGTCDPGYVNRCRCIFW